MADIPLSTLLKVLTDAGVIGLILFLWWYDNRRIWVVLKQYQADMVEMRKMYENNVSLCKDFSSVSHDLREVVILNVQQMTTMNDAIRQNQYCPVVRIDKKQIIIGERS